MKALKIPEYGAKLLIVGDSSVGKTSMLVRYTEDRFSSSHLMTLGLDVRVKRIPFDDLTLKMQIWDTAGQERFKNLTSSYFKGSSGIILVYSCDSCDSFTHITSWIKQANANTPQDTCKILVANKCDLDESVRSVTTEEGKKLAAEYKLHFFETSAKWNVNIQEAFGYIATMIKDQIVSSPDRISILDISESDRPKPTVFSSELYFRPPGSHSRSPVKTTLPLITASNTSGLLMQGEFVNLKYGDPVLLDPSTPTKLPESSAFHIKFPRSLSLEQTGRKRRRKNSNLSFKQNQDHSTEIHAQLEVSKIMSMPNERKTTNPNRYEEEKRSLIKRHVEAPTHKQVILSNLVFEIQKEFGLNSQSQKILPLKTKPFFEHFAAYDQHTGDTRGGKQTKAQSPSLITQLCTPFMMEQRNYLSHLRGKFIEEYRSKRQNEEYLFYTGKGTPLRKRNSSSGQFNKQNDDSTLPIAGKDSSPSEKDISIISGVPALKLTL